MEGERRKGGNFLKSPIRTRQDAASSPACFSFFWSRRRGLVGARPAALGQGVAGAAAHERLGLLLLLPLLLAVDAQRGDRAGDQAAVADRLAALLALVDGPRLQPVEGAVDLAQQPLLTVAQAQFGREQLLLHRLVDGVAADVAIAVHAEGQALLGVAEDALLLLHQHGPKLVAFLFLQHEAVPPAGKHIDTPRRLSINDGVAITPLQGRASARSGRRGPSERPVGEEGTRASPKGTNRPEGLSVRSGSNVLLGTAWIPAEGAQGEPPYNVEGWDRRLRPHHRHRHRLAARRRRQGQGR